ncbi:MAG: alpha/beta fold hydrolase, partial [Pseudomonadota bacterium]|nr:alpha/beta fold hydrolase [Pseudomonadota bacterium]
SAYRAHSYRRDVAYPAAVWSEGSTRLLKYPSTSGAPKADLFVIPSLINRAYVLDLSSRSSFMRWLAARGFNGYLVDWGRPGPAEQNFDLTDYIAGRLGRAFHAIANRTERPTLLIGYCLGGDLALAHALRHQNAVSGLALLATPWDFHAADAIGARAISAMADAVIPQLDLLGELPTDFLQLLFCTLDPLLGFRKFQTFAKMDQSSDRALDFVALEDWLNDGVPLTTRVAQECLGDWYGNNTPAGGSWQIDGQPVSPSALSIPSIAVIPAHDRIVPPESAMSLARSLPDCHTISPQAGHIGMMAGRNAEATVWRPLETWLAAQCAK